MFCVSLSSHKHYIDKNLSLHSPPPNFIRPPCYCLQLSCVHFIRAASMSSARYMILYDVGLSAPVDRES